MRLKCDNKILVENQPKTILTSPVSAAGVTLTVGSNDGLANADYLLLGIIGEEKAEIVKINAAVTHGTSITITACVFDHDRDTPVTKVDYNQVCFYHGTTTVAADSTVIASGQSIDPTEVYSYYEDGTYTTGYGFVRFYNSTTTKYSIYSDAINYSLKIGYNNKMLRSIRTKVRRLIRQTDEQNTDYTNDDIDEEINLAQKEVAHDRMWSFYEKIKSFSSEANRYEYELATNVFTLFEAKFDTQPLIPITSSRWNLYRWDTDVTGDPTHICMWSRKALVYPYPSAGAATTTLNGNHNATVTTITLASTASLPTQGRILIDDEVISYTGKTTTTITGCIRGEEDTEASTHSTGVTVTERDFVYHFQEDPDDLVDETDETAIPDPSLVAYKAAAELTEGPTQDRLYQKYNISLKQLRKVDEPKLKASFGTVVDASNTGIRNQNDFPSNLSSA